MKKNKKLLLTLGTAAAIVSPIAAVVSCGSGSAAKNPFDYPDLSTATEISIDDLDKDTADSLIAELVSTGNYPDEDAAKAAVNKINLRDLNLFMDDASDEITDPEVKQTLTNLNNTLQKWAFDNNENGARMTGLVNWLDKSGISTFSSQSARGPWVTDSTQGVASYYRNDFLDLKSVSTFTGYDLLSSSFVKDTPNKENQITVLNSTSVLKKGDRIFDPSFQKGSAFIDTQFSNAAFSVFRAHVVGKDEHTSDQNGIKWTREKTTTHELFKGLNISLATNGTPVANSDGETDADKFKELITSNSSANEIVFNTKGDVKYASADGAGGVQQSTESFKARDLFQGFVRTLYSSKDMRDKAVYNGINLSSVLPKFTADEQKDWTNLFAGEDQKAKQAAADAYTNPNVYLLGLYGVDIEKTISENISSGNKDEFRLIFKDNSLKPTSLNLFIDNDLISPKHLAAANEAKLTGIPTDIFKTLELSEGVYSGSGDVKNALKGVLSVAPYVLTSYGMEANQEQTIQLSPSFVDPDQTKADKQVKKFTTIVEEKNVDATSMQQSRKAAFQEAGSKVGANEYVLDPRVEEVPSMLADLTEYKQLSKPNRTGATNAMYLSWAPQGFKDSGYNNLGRKMLYGIESVSDIETSTDAVESFYSGSGAKVRDSIKAAVNWYTMAQTLFPGKHKTFYPSMVAAEEFKASKVDSSEETPEYISSNLENIYKQNIGDNTKAWTSDFVAKAAKTLDDVATQAGATAENPAQIPIFAYIWTNPGATPAQENTNKQVLDRLNKLSPKVHFVNQERLGTWDEFVQKAIRKSIYATRFTGFGPDYPGVGSILQQFISAGYTGGVVGLFKDILNNPRT